MDALSRNVLIVFVLAAALYSVTLPGDFVYDDIGVLLMDPRINDLSRWGEYVTGGYNFGVDNLYRPLVSLSYALQYQLHTQIAWPYHVVNVGLHAVASALVVWMVSELARRTAMPRPDAIGLVAGLLFAAHPVHVEAIANIVGRAEPMCAIGTLLALGLATRPLGMGRVIAIWLCVVVAMLCKEQGLLVPLMVATVWWLCRDAKEPRDTRNAIVLGSLLLASVAALVLFREKAIGLSFAWDRTRLDPWVQPLAFAHGPDRWLSPVSIVGHYAGLLVAPVTLKIDYGRGIVPAVFDLRDPYVWLGIGAIVAWFTILAIGVWRRDRFVMAATILFAISYVLVSNWPTIIGVNVAERVMYLPSVFFLMLIARLLVVTPKPVLVGVTALLLIAGGVRSVTYARQWNERRAFYDYIVSVEPRSMKALQLALGEYALKNEFKKADELAQRAIALDPSYDEAWLSRAAVLIAWNRLDLADDALKHARSLRVTSKLEKLEGKLATARAATQPYRYKRP